MRLRVLACLAVLVVRLAAELSCAIAPDGHDELPCSMEAPCANMSFAVSVTGCTTCSFTAAPTPYPRSASKQSRSRLLGFFLFCMAAEKDSFGDDEPFFSRDGEEVLVHEDLIVRGDSSTATPPLLRGNRAQSSQAGFSFFIANDSSASPFAISIALRGLCFARAASRRGAVDMALWQAWRSMARVLRAALSTLPTSASAVST